MTVLNATLTKAAFILCQDQAHTTPDGVFVGCRSKIITRRARRLIAGAAGTVTFTNALACFLDELPVFDPDRIAMGLRDLPDPHSEQVVVVGWWDETLGHPVAYCFKADDAFAPLALAVGNGHVISPAEAVIEDRGSMLTASVAASQGEGLVAFHVRLAQAQKKAAMQGLIDKPGWKPHSIGGRLDVACLDCQGVTIQTLPVFGSEAFGSVGDVLAAQWARYPAAA